MLTAIFYMLRNYEMKNEINCFIIFTIDKYEIFYIIIGRDISSRKIVSSRTKYLLSFRTKCIDQGQTIHFIPNENDYN
jgi:hypothetical protein